ALQLGDLPFDEGLLLLRILIGCALGDIAALPRLADHLGHFRAPSCFQVLKFFFQILETIRRKESISRAMFYHCNPSTKSKPTGRRPAGGPQNKGANLDEPGVA